MFIHVSVVPILGKMVKLQKSSHKILFECDMNNLACRSECVYLQ